MSADERADLPAAPTSREIARALDRALEVRQRLRDRSPRETATALAAAARRWIEDEELHRGLPAVARLSAPMVGSVLPRVAAALDVEAMVELVNRERGMSPPPGLVAAVVASNVPALAVPAIALGCLAGAAVLVKSGRGDPLSAPAFHRALAAVDPELAATVVPAYWPGGTSALEQAALARAEVVVASGSDLTMEALRRRVGRRLVAHGTRTSVVALDIRRERCLDTLVRAVALDVVLYDQRGCLSPQVALVAGDREAFADALVRALAALRPILPPGEATLEERAAIRLAIEEASWAGAHAVRAGLGGTVLVETWADLRPGPGGRTIRVCPLDSLRALPTALPLGRIECIAIYGDEVDVAALEARGVARLCQPGRMQDPPLAWPRGQRPALGSLLRPDDPMRTLLDERTLPASAMRTCPEAP